MSFGWSFEDIYNFNQFTYVSHINFRPVAILQQSRGRGQLIKYLSHECLIFHFSDS